MDSASLILTTDNLLRLSVEESYIVMIKDTETQLAVSKKNFKIAVMKGSFLRESLGRPFHKAYLVQILSYT
jgi:hypothetical protein